MIVEACRITADGLSDDVYGVNLKLAALDRDKHDPAPPGVVGVLDVTRNASISGGEAGVDFEYPSDWPALIVSPFGAFTTEGQASPNMGKLDGTGAGVQISYYTAQQDLAAAFRDGAYTVRAVSQCMTSLFANGNAAARTRNNIILISISRRQWGPVALKRGPGYITADFVAEFHTRDLAP